MGSTSRDAVALSEAVTRKDPHILPLAWQGRVRILAGLLPLTALGRR